MSRTKGAKDLKPRRISPASLAALRPHPTTPGYVSFLGRTYAPAAVERWWSALSSVERGEVLERAMRRG